MVVTYTDPEETPHAAGADAGAEPGPRPKRPITEAKWAANSVNSSRATGPTSTTGKARSALRQGGSWLPGEVCVPRTKAVRPLRPGDPEKNGRPCQIRDSGGELFLSIETHAGSGHSNVCLRV
jgi:hypothetical protein